MRAITYDRYTDTSGLDLTDQPQPEPGAGQVLVRVAAASLNALDWHMYRGEPLIMRAAEGFRLRSPRTVGADFAGTVEALGEGVDDLEVGDRVFGAVGRGSCADYVAADATGVARTPNGLDFATAAALPIAGITALQGIRDCGELRAGERVLVWGASGGVGHYAVQIAKALGASEVHAVCSGRNADMVRGLGASALFDYAAGELPAPPEKYDLIIDLVGTASAGHTKSLLSDDGRVVLLGSLGGGRLLGPASTLAKRHLAAKLRGFDMRNVLARTSRADLDTLAEFAAAGAVRPVIAGRFPLADVPAACRELEQMHVAGKLLIEVADA